MTGRPPNTMLDAVKSFGSGIESGLTGLADLTNPIQAVKTGAQIGQGLVNMATGSHDQSPLAQVLPQSTTQAAAPYGAAFQPQTTVGRYAKAIGQAAPNLIGGPETLGAKAASVILPAVGAQGATDAASALGAPAWAQGVAGVAGGLLGGLGVGAVGPARGILNAPESPVNQAVQSGLKLGQVPMSDIQDGLSQGLLPAATSPGLRGLTKTVAGQPGPARAAISDAIASRVSTLNGQVPGLFKDVLGVDPEAAAGNIEQLVKNGQAKVDPLYTQMRANTAPVWNDRLASLAQRPAIKKAIGVAANDALNAGQNPTALGFRLDPDTGWELNGSTGSINPETGGVETSGAQTEQQPTAATWIAVHQALGRTVDRNPITNAVLPDSVSAGNHGISVAGGDLGTALKQTIPGYATALAQSGDYLTSRNAFNRAQGSLFNGSVANFNKAWASLKTPAEQAAFRAGLANDVLTPLGKTNAEGISGGQFAPGAFKTRDVQAKLSTAFGPDATAQFTDQMAQNISERQAYQDVLGGSDTVPKAQLDAHFSAQNAPSGIKAVLSDPTKSLHTMMSFTHLPTAVTALLSMAAHRGGGKVPLAPWNNPETNAALGQALSSPQAFQGILGSIDQRRAAIQGAQATQRQGLLAAPRYAIPGLINGGLLGR